MTIDITKPLELSDGTRVAHAEFDCEGDIEAQLAGEGFIFFQPNGEPVSNWRKEANGRTLRNVKESEVRTGLEHIERLERLARRIADRPAGTVPPVEIDIEAREIVAELDKGKVSEDESFAKQQAEHWAPDMVTPLASARLTSLEAMAKNCIAKGRELERSSVGNARQSGTMDDEIRLRR